MHNRSITAPGFLGWKTWGPAFNTVFFAAVGILYWKQVWGVFPVLDGIIIILILTVLAQIWWIAIVIKQVEFDGDDIRISGLRKSVTVPRNWIVDVKDRSNFKRIPSVIVLSSPIEFGKQIRFFPAKPVSDVVSQLMRHLPTK